MLREKMDGANVITYCLFAENLENIKKNKKKYTTNYIKILIISSLGLSVN